MLARLLRCVAPVRMASIRRYIASRSLGVGSFRMVDHLLLSLGAAFSADAMDNIDIFGSNDNASFAKFPFWVEHEHWQSCALFGRVHFRDSFSGEESHTWAAILAIINDRLRESSLSNRSFNTLLDNWFLTFEKCDFKYWISSHHLLRLFEHHRKSNKCFDVASFGSAPDMVRVLEVERWKLDVKKCSP